MGSFFEADPEVRLMLRVRADEAGAYEELVRRVAPPLLCFMYRHTKDQHLAEDLTQEVLLRVHRARHDYVAGARFRTWLYRIATNLGLNRLRYESYRQAASLDASAGEDAVSLHGELRDEGAEAPGLRLERAELRERVQRAVAKLPPGQRTAVMLLRFEQLSYEEIAEAMDLSLQATKSLLNRAKENLRRLLAGDVEAWLSTAGARASKG